METIRIKGRQLEPEQLDKLIKFNIPAGFSVRDKEHRFAEKARLNELRCAKHYQKRAAEELKNSGDADVRRLVGELKRQGREKDIEAAVKEFHANAKKTVPDHLAYVCGAPTRCVEESKKVSFPFGAAI